MEERIKIAVNAGDWPPKRALNALARRAIAAAVAAIGEEARRHPSPNPCPQGGGEIAELSIVFTDDAGMRELNNAWRGKDRPTNVLAFPQPEGPLLGDVILAAETVAREAALADKPLEDHMAHLIIHGFLHLLGHDHAAGRDAEKMEQLERVALERMGIPDPYAPARGR